MLGNSQIKNLVENSQLIDCFNENSLRNCSYRLRVGKLIKPGDTTVLEFNGTNKVVDNWLYSWIKKMKGILNRYFSLDQTSHLKVVNSWYELKPNELIIFQTKEKIKMPLNLSGSYTALDSIAKYGLLLINASIVEPEYEGYLSGVLLNFSSRSFYIKPEMEIVKIHFNEISGIVKAKVDEIVPNYTEKLQDRAKYFTQTFLDIERIENEVISKTVRRVRKSFTFGGLFLLFLLAFCTLEPILYKYVWHDTWVPLNSTQIELERSLQQSKQSQQIDSLMKKVDFLQKQIENTNAGNTDSKS